MASLRVGGREVSEGDPCAPGVHGRACASQVVTDLFYSQETPKIDGPPDAGEMGRQGGKFGTNPWEHLGTLPSPILAAEPVRVAVLDCSGVAFADAAGAREVVQVRTREVEAKLPLSSQAYPLM